MKTKIPEQYKLVCDVCGIEGVIVETESPSKFLLNGHLRLDSRNSTTEMDLCNDCYARAKVILQQFKDGEL